MNKGLYIAFWEKESGNGLSHHKGLTQEQVDELKALKAGDRLIIFVNRDKRSDASPAYTLKRFNPPARDDGGTEGGI